MSLSYFRKPLTKRITFFPEFKLYYFGSDAYSALLDTIDMSSLNIAIQAKGKRSDRFPTTTQAAINGSSSLVLGSGCLLPQPCAPLSYPDLLPPRSYTQRMGTCPVASDWHALPFIHSAFTEMVFYKRAG